MEGIRHTQLKHLEELKPSDVRKNNAFRQQAEADDLLQPLTRGSRSRLRRCVPSTRHFHVTA